MKELIKLAKQHQAADDYVRGTFGGVGKDGVFRGCDVGCTIYDYNKLHGTNIDYDDHEALALALDVPEFLIHLQDLFFENTSDAVSQTWPVDFLEALHSAGGKDLTLVQPKFLLYILKDNNSPAVEQVRAVFQNWIETGAVDKDAAMEARVVAEVAARAATWAAVAAEGAVDAARATWAAALAARVALASRATWAAALAARVAAYDDMAKELLKLIRE